MIRRIAGVVVAVVVAAAAVYLLGWLTAAYAAAVWVG